MSKTERAIRWTALGLMLAVAIALFWFGRAEPEPEADLAASAQPVSTPFDTADGSSGLARELAERGESALAKKTPPPPESSGDQPAQPKPRPTQAQAARDLPSADDPLGDSRPGSGSAARPRGPCGGIEVRAITTSPDPDWAFASLAEGEGLPAAISRIGARIGSYRVAKIEWDRVWLSSGGGRCAVSLNEGARAGMERSADAGVVFPMPLDEDPRPPPWRLPRELAYAIEKKDVDHFLIEAAMIKPLFARAPELLDGVTLTPVEREETVVGVALDGIQEGSLLHHFGIESGDVLLKLDQEICASLAAVQRALAAAQKAERLMVTLERAGRRRELLIEAQRV
jgi:general secretion pathway protein C